METVTLEVNLEFSKESVLTVFALVAIIYCKLLYSGEIPIQMFLVGV
jgi:hypothetical protein